MSSIAFPPDETTTAVPAPATPTPTPMPTDTDLVAARAARNRANAQKSTGPRTREGKQRSSQNARTHGLSADGILSTTPAAIPRDLAADPTFQLATQELVDEFRPVTPMQKVLVGQLAHLTWKLDQIPKLERQLLATPLGATTPTPLPPPIRVSDDDDDAVNDETPTPPDPTNDLTVQHLLQNEPTPLTRLWDHHRRLLGRTQSLLRQLIQLQKEERRRTDEDNDVESARDRSRRLAADHAVIDQTLDAMRARHRAEREHRDHATQPAPAQNEPTPTSPPDDTETDDPALVSTPAQNEPTPQWTMDNRQLTNPINPPTPPTDTP